MCSWLLIFSEPTCSVSSGIRTFSYVACGLFQWQPFPFRFGLKQKETNKKKKRDRESYLKEIFYIVHVVILEDTQIEPINPSFCHSLNISSSNENQLHLSVKIIPYKGLHLLLAIIPEEYIIIIYCHWEWQWKQCYCTLNCKTKKRQWRGLASCICSFSNVHAHPADVTHGLFMVATRCKYCI